MTPDSYYTTSLQRRSGAQRGDTPLIIDIHTHVLSVPTSDGSVHQIRGDGHPVLAALVASTLTPTGAPLIGAISALTQDSGVTQTVDSGTITLDDPGRSRFIATVGGATMYLESCAVEQAALDAVATRLNPLSAEGNGTARAWRVLRTVADQVSSFDGTASTLPANLATYGADSGAWGTAAGAVVL
jgi:hypothetical protein